MTGSNRVRVYGPPGTGKTTWLAGEVEKLVTSGVPGEAIAVASFSRAAFREFTARIGGQVPRDNLGTIHSLAYRALGNPELALTKERIAQWNAQVPDTWRLTPRVDHRGNTVDALDPYSEEEGGLPGDQIYDQLVYLRNTMRPMAQWPEEVKAFWARWRAWMSQESLVDFPAMLERALVLPGLGVDYLFVDEAQDLTPLQLELVKKWAAGTRYTALVGDDDQSIYAHLGADGTSFLSFPVDREVVLSQSYRVPAKVQALAEAIIGRARNRAEKRYRPRPEEGEVAYLRVPPDDPRWAVENAERAIQRGESVLFLATTRYYLEDLKGVLAERGLPWGNPYAPKRPSLNLFPDDERAGWQKARAFLFPKRLGKDVKAWARYLTRVPFLGKKAEALEAIAALPDEAVIPDDHPVWGLFRPEHRPHIAARDPGWLLDHLLGSAPKGMRSALMVATRHSDLVLQGKALVWIGTIHSVKGGEADHVYVWPGYTRRAAEGLRENPDALHRLMYVAVTRARRRVVLMDQGKAPHGYPWPRVDEYWGEVWV